MKNLRCRRHRGRKGAEVLEFSLCFLPLLMMLFLLMDVSWAIFVKSSLQYAVRAGVRYGVTVTKTEANGSDLTTLVKSVVQQNSMGLLSGSTGLAKIKVYYLQPPAPGSTAAATDVSTQTYGNTPGNIMQVTIQGFSLIPLAPRIFSWKTAPDGSSTVIGAIAADVIEPSNDVPAIGTAP
jgi:Flp pilus assembly protein TadG